MTCNHRRATDAATDEYTGQNREGRRHGKKRPDDRRTRNWARAMENRPKPPTSDPLAQGEDTDPYTGASGTREKTARRPSDTELGARHGKQAKTTDE